MSIERALRIAREAGGETQALNALHVPHTRPKKIKPPRAEKFVKHLNAGAGVHTGPIHSTVAGRTDHLPIGVPSGSYVLSADVVSHLGENNTAAGFANLKRMFGGMPRGGGEQPYNHEGGPYGMATGGTAPEVPIVAAGGEYVVHPHHVKEIGGGDLDTGHKVLDEFSKRIRAEMVKTLKKLPPPARN
jgi:hypothetical protein